MKDNPIIVGLDIGTTKITTVIGEVGDDGSVDIIGEGSVPSEGMKRGAVVNLERATGAIRQSVQAAERVSGVRVASVFVSVAGNHVKAITSHGLAAIRRHQEIAQADVDRAIENARAVPLDPNLEIIHTLPQEYVVDGQEGIKSAVGMHGVRLEVDVHIVAGTAGPLLNLRRCVQEAGLKVEGFVLQALASGLATLEAAEQSQTVVVIDMGGGTTDVGVFKRGNLAHSACIPIGGDHVTADLAQILKLPHEEAENVKRRYGAAVPELADPDLTLEITTSNGSTHAISAFELSRIIKPRLTEIFGMVRDEIDQALGPVELVAQSVVLTGGASLLRGIPELARDRFRLPVRVGRPRGIGGLTDIVNGPAHAGGVGLVLYGIGQDGKVPVSVFRPEEPATPPPPAPQPQAAAKSGPEPKKEPGTVTVVTPAPGQPAPKKERPKDGASLKDRVRGFFKDWM
ncbi:cell division protein FtsA [Deinococcus sp. MIMF12]|uniref:Cell division protein FtsA n=1 Tax=Deinococcus rhizophilus TaxID=3049544 RepID=A0ABT7JF36_9DEIO|nr:cell division protein FtsA [Deinococcus rhizophilus]MDL2343556.1 cell division protein FtsA [Deinococcus rhizophilus]